MMPPDTQHDERAPGSVESRARPRVKVHSLAYVELGEGNAGLILNISETGMAVQAVQMLSSNLLPRMQFRLPKTDTLIEAPGKLIWQIRSKKEAGIEFAGLSEQAKAAIRSWIAAELARQGLAGQLRPADKSKADALKADPPKTASNKAVRDRSAQDERPAPVAPSAERQTERQAEAPHAKPPRPAVTPAGLHGADEKQAHIRPPDRPAPKEPVALPTPPGMRGVPSHWRTQPGPVPKAEPGGTRGYDPEAFPERVPAMPRWNGYMAPGVGMQFRKHRRWWTYTAAIGILAALGFAGLMVFNPDAITRARVDALIHTPNGSGNNQSAAGNETSPSTSQSANNNEGSANTQSAPAPQAPASNVPGQGLPPNSQGSSPAVPPANNPAGAASAANSAATNPSGGSRRAQSNQSASAPAVGGSNTANGGKQYQTRSQQPANTAPPQQQNPRVASNQSSQYGRSAQAPARQNTGREYAQNGNEPGNSRYSAAPAENSPSNSSSPASRNSGNQTYASNSQPQQPANPAQSNQSALKAWRAQTTPPSAPGTAPNAGKTSNQATAPQQAQDAYKNSAPYKPASGANSPSTSNPSPNIIVVGTPGYQSMAVPPSMPLSGVPSGSVAATSQVRAIRIPTSLSWARRYLPGNLGLGQLLSSYSPAYPIEAAREGIQGTVTLDVIVGTDGTVRNVSVLSGPAMLSSAAVSAVRDWRYGETFLAGEPIETEQHVSMVFRLTSGQ